MKDKGYLLIYSFTDFINGVIVGTAGPLIPFLAASTHRPATSYYFLFISRSVGAVIGAIIYKSMQAYYRASDHHKILGVTSILYFGITAFPLRQLQISCEKKAINKHEPSCIL